MSKFDKLVKKFFSNSSVSFNDAEKILFYLGFHLKIKGSHHHFRKKDYRMTVTLTNLNELLPYQVKMLRQVLEDHGYKKN